jgi:hypothetical protein
LSISTKKPAGIRGGVSSSYWLHQGHGAPAAPQGQAFGPSHGLPGWDSHTHPMSWQRVHLIISEFALNLLPFGQTYQNLGDCNVQLQRRPPSMHFELGGVPRLSDCCSREAE